MNHLDRLRPRVFFLVGVCFSTATKKKSKLFLWVHFLRAHGLTKNLKKKKPTYYHSNTHPGTQYTVTHMLRSLAQHKIVKTSIRWLERALSKNDRTM